MVFEMVEIFSSGGCSVYNSTNMSFMRGWVVVHVCVVWRRRVEGVKNTLKFLKWLNVE